MAICYAKVSEQTLLKFLSCINDGLQLIEIKTEMRIASRTTSKYAKMLFNRGLIRPRTHRYSGWVMTPEGIALLSQSKMTSETHNANP